MENLPATVSRELDEASASPSEPVAIGTLMRQIVIHPTPEMLEQQRLRQEREAEQASRDRDMAIQLEGQRLRRQAGQRYAGCRLDTFETSNGYQKRVVHELREYARSIDERCKKAEGLVLYGPVGTGKDHLAYSVAVSAVLTGLTIGWLNGQDWFGQIRDAIDDDTSEATLIGRIAKPHLVVISDPLPPVGQLTQHQAAMLYRAVESRYSRGKATVVTVNVADDGEADHRLGAPTWDRLCHGAWKVFCNWPSYRRPTREIKP